MSLPVDFDTPAGATRPCRAPRGETRRLAFGLMPLGTVGGRVVRDQRQRSGRRGRRRRDGSSAQSRRRSRDRNRSATANSDSTRSAAAGIQSSCLPQSLPEGGRIVGEPSAERDDRSQHHRAGADLRRRHRAATRDPARIPGGSASGRRRRLPTRPRGRRRPHRGALQLRVPPETASARPRPTPAPAGNPGGIDAGVQVTAVRHSDHRGQRPAARGRHHRAAAEGWICRLPRASTGIRAGRAVQSPRGLLRDARRGRQGRSRDREAAQRKSLGRQGTLTVTRIGTV